jgi:DNA helicase-2/ATP-dependent DNA helicase PcrA
LFTERGQGEKVILHEALDDRIEASHVVDTIAGLVARSQSNPSDFAVMYRTNAQSRLLEEAFLHAGLPYKLVGAQRFYGRREIKDIIAYLRLVHNPNDEVSLTRIINVPTRGIGSKTYRSLRTQAQQTGLSPGKYLVYISKDPESPERDALPGRAGKVLENFGKMLLQWIDARDTLSPLALMDRILEDVDYHAYIDDGSDEGNDRWENVMELRRLASEFQEQGLEEFLERVALVSDQDTLETSINVPTLLTLHAAKGLEFPVVFITGLNDGMLPHSRSFEDPEAMMEERRLLYVGITRAKDRLYLLYTQSRSAYGYTEPVEPSRFLWDIPDGLLTATTTFQAPRRTAAQVSYRPERWKPVETVETVSQAQLEPSYQPGTRVQHPAWGEGMVLNSRLQGDDEIVDIFFQDVGLKRVMASLAQLEIKP